MNCIVILRFQICYGFFRKKLLFNFSKLVIFVCRCSAIALSGFIPPPRASLSVSIRYNQCVSSRTKFHQIFRNKWVFKLLISRITVTFLLIHYINPSSQGQTQILKLRTWVGAFFKYCTYSTSESTGIGIDKVALHSTPTLKFIKRRSQLRKSLKLSIFSCSRAQRQKKFRNITSFSQILCEWH